MQSPKSSWRQACRQGKARGIVWHDNNSTMTATTTAAAGAAAPLATVTAATTATATTRKQQHEGISSVSPHLGSGPAGWNRTPFTCLWSGLHHQPPARRLCGFRRANPTGDRGCSPSIRGGSRRLQLILRTARAICPPDVMEVVGHLRTRSLDLRVCYLHRHWPSGSVREPGD